MAWDRGTRFGVLLSLGTGVDNGAMVKKPSVYRADADTARRVLT